MLFDEFCSECLESFFGSIRGVFTGSIVTAWCLTNYIKMMTKASPPMTGHSLVGNCICKFDCHQKSQANFAIH